jgi:cytochrome c-type biogenesis protein CcmF
MIAELGHFALALALAVALVQSAAPFASANDRRLAGATNMAAHAQLILIAIAFLALVYLFVVSDFSVRTVAENSHSEEPLFYRVAGVWSNHEGSMVLWVLLLAVFGSLHAATRHPIDVQLKARALGFQGMIGAAFLAFILITSDPFSRLSPAPLEGQDINPILQDPALAIHPPMLYVGYVGFSVCFALAMAGLVNNRIDGVWGRAVRPWALVSWIALTLGVALGSFWAYYVLGFGGFWFWDPVENASLLPWLAGTALLHSAIVVERRDALRGWTVLLAILAFAMSLLGTFLVRSGVLTSVHAFASSPERGVFMLAIFIGFVGIALSLFAWRAPSLAPGGGYRAISRESAIVLNSLLLSSAAAAVLMGTLYPMTLEALTGDLVSVGPPYFNLVVGLMMAPLFLALPMGPLMAWKRGDFLAVISKLWIAALAGLAVMAAAVLVSHRAPIEPVLIIGAGGWLIVGALTDLADRAMLFRVAPGRSLRRVLTLPRASYGTMFAHAGFGLVLIGVAASGAFKDEALQALSPGGSLQLGASRVTLVSVVPVQGPNFSADRATFRIASPGGTVTATGEKRRFWTRRTETTKIALVRRGLSEIYIALGDPRASPSGATTWAVHAYYHPFVLLIWLGAVVMAAGGALALSDRRLRLAVIRRRIIRPSAQPQAQPAE